MRGESDSPIMAEFVGALDEINGLAETSPGFVWRYQTEGGNAMTVRPYEDPLIVINLSVWTTPETLRAFTYGTLHGKYFARRAAWFERLESVHFALWWVPAGSHPTPDEAKTRLAHRERHGDTPYAFSFRSLFPAEAGIVAYPSG